MYRDLPLSLRCGLHNAAAGFSFLRLCGLRALLRALRSVADAGVGAGALLHQNRSEDMDLMGSMGHLSIHNAYLLRTCPTVQASPSIPSFLTEAPVLRVLRVCGDN